MQARSLFLFDQICPNMPLAEPVFWCPKAVVSFGALRNGRAQGLQRDLPAWVIGCPCSWQETNQVQVLVRLRRCPVLLGQSVSQSHSLVASGPWAAVGRSSRPLGLGKEYREGWFLGGWKQPVMSTCYNSTFLVSRQKVLEWANIRRYR